jgi:hypothetical protein
MSFDVYKFKYVSFEEALNIVDGIIVLLLGGYELGEIYEISCNVSGYYNIVLNNGKTYKIGKNLSCYKIIYLCR